MGIFNLLTEARIREWQQRAPETSSNAQESSVDPLSNDPFEVQLFKEILALLDKGRAEQIDSSTRWELLNKAGQLETQLMVLLEQAGRPLAARQLAATINAHRVHP